MREGANESALDAINEKAAIKRARLFLNIGAMMGLGDQVRKVLHIRTAKTIPKQYPEEISPQRRRDAEKRDTI